MTQRNQVVRSRVSTFERDRFLTALEGLDQSEAIREFVLAVNDVGYKNVKSVLILVRKSPNFTDSLIQLLGFK